MSEPFIAQIVMFGGNFAPRNWAFCDGQLLSINQHQALFSLLGTTYGGDGRTTFGLPDLRGRVSIHPGNGPGLSNYRLGQKGGAETVTLTTAEIPSHAHNLQNNAVDDDSNSTSVANSALASGGSYSTDTPDAMTKPTSTADTGGSRSHTNIQPFTCVNYIIALEGIFPSRN